MIDLIAELEQARRSVGSGDLNGRGAHVVEVRRMLGAPVADVWDACTDPDRVRRWFLPLTGDLRPGGRFQLEGNAGGEIRTCEPPSRFVLTWESVEAVPSLLSVELIPAGDDTDLRLRHVVPDDDHWAEYGPGAVGVGWDLAVLGLASFVARQHVTGADLMADPSAPVFMRRSAAEWGAAHEAAGAAPETAREAATRTSAAYVPDDQPAAQR
jgi:uncharacterized protein YndB with AHSA1/START domain